MNQTPVSALSGLLFAYRYVSSLRSGKEAYYGSHDLVTLFSLFGLEDTVSYNTVKDIVSDISGVDIDNRQLVNSLKRLQAKNLVVNIPVKNRSGYRLTLAGRAAVIGLDKKMAELMADRG